MRPSRPSWPALLVVLGLMACTPTSPEESHATEPEGPSLYLELASLTGDTVFEALIQLSSGQRQQADTRGTLLLEKLQVGPQLLEVKARDHYPTLLTFDMAEGVRAGARLKLIPLGEPFATFDAKQGTTVNREGVTLTIPPGALLDARGNPIKGRVDAFLTALDMKNGELVAAPGMLEGIPAPGAEPVGLESLGMMALVFQQEGKVVPLARGIRIRGSVPGSIRVGSQGGPGSSPVFSRRGTLSEGPLPRVPVWGLDPDSGRWVPTGDWGHLEESSTVPGSLEVVATLNNPASPFQFALPNWSFSSSASSDNPLQVPEPAWVETACLAVRVEDEQGQPVPGRVVVAQGRGHLGFSLSRALTDADGRARLEVMRDQIVDVDAGAEVRRVVTGTAAGNCRGQGAEPASVSLRVPARTCTPGSALDCGTYSGPQGSLGQGICRAARRSCDAEGTGWSDTCEGEVLPQEERCDNTQDDNCDGATSETCATICQAGQTRSCYGGPLGTEGVGECRVGTQTCNGSGTGWSACTGERTPQAENCANVLDDDCDGQINEAFSCDWAATASMASPRRWHTATLLNNGKVLVVGGFDGGAVLQTAELYDSATHTWTPAGSMASPRRRHTATLLSNGQVLVTGGDGGGSSIQTAELYDPTSNTWSSAGSMASPRNGNTATLLNNGKVLVTGGFTGSVYLKTFELYDPTSNTWSTPKLMNSWRQGHTATPLGNGKVLVTGGYDGQNFIPSAELYDLNSDTSTLTQPMASPRRGHKAMLLSNGQVLVTGGHDGGLTLQTFELYDPSSNTWSPAESMTSPRDGHTATSLSNGQVLVTGGYDGGRYLRASELYDSRSNTWTQADFMTSRRSGHTATLLSNGQVLVTGGYDGSKPVPSAELYSP